MKQRTTSSLPGTEERTGGRSGHSPKRTCLSCGAQQEAKGLLRFVRAPRGDILLDTLNCAPGRGVYVCCNLSCLREALRVAKLTHAFRQTVIGPEWEPMCQEIRRMLYRRLGLCLGMGQKRGEIVSGYAALQQAFSQARVLGIILAEDIAVRRAEEYRALCAQYAISYVTLLTKDELGRVLGRPSRSAVGLTDAHVFDVLRSTLVSLARLQPDYSTVEIHDFFS